MPRTIADAVPFPPAMVDINNFPLSDEEDDEVMDDISNELAPSTTLDYPHCSLDDVLEAMRIWTAEFVASLPKPQEYARVHEHLSQGFELLSELIDPFNHREPLIFDHLLPIFVDASHRGYMYAVHYAGLAKALRRWTEGIKPKPWTRPAELPPITNARAPLEYKVYQGKWEEPLIAAEKRVQESAAVKGKGKEDGKNKQKEKVQGWKGEEGVLKAKETVSKGGQPAGKKVFPASTAGPAPGPSASKKVFPASTAGPAPGLSAGRSAKPAAVNPKTTVRVPPPPPPQQPAAVEQNEAPATRCKRTARSNGKSNPQVENQSEDGDDETEEEERAAVKSIGRRKPAPAPSPAVDSDADDEVEEVEMHRLPCKSCEKLNTACYVNKVEEGAGARKRTTCGPCSVKKRKCSFVEKVVKGEGPAPTTATGSRKPLEVARARPAASPAPPKPSRKRASRKKAPTPVAAGRPGELKGEQIFFIVDFFITHRCSLDSRQPSSQPRRVARGFRTPVQRARGGLLRYE